MKTVIIIRRYPHAFCTKPLVLMLAFLMCLPAFALAQQAPDYPRLTQHEGLHEYADFALAPLEKTPWDASKEDVIALWGEAEMMANSTEDGFYARIEHTQLVTMWQDIDFGSVYEFHDNRLTMITHAFRCPSAKVEELHAQVLEEMKRVYGDPVPVTMGFATSALGYGLTLSDEQYEEPVPGDNWISPDGGYFINLGGPAEGASESLSYIIFMYTRVANAQ